MDGRSTNSATKVRNALQTPSLSKLPEKAVTVSTARVFKARKLDTPHLQSKLRSAERSTAKKARVKRHEEEAHPLALAFKEQSQEYRRHLYSTAVARINQDLDALLHKLYESSLQDASSDAAEDDPRASPLRLSIPAKYQRTVQNLYRPISGYHYNVPRTTASGETKYVQTTLHERFQTFEENMLAETAQIEELQRQWESVIAEIFQLGSACLGEIDIATLLSTANVDVSATSPASKAESSLFVPEHDDSAKGGAKRKRVSFNSSGLLALFPAFLFHVPEHQKQVPAAPDLPAGEIQRFEKEISGLGKQHTADLHRLEKEHKAWWTKKQQQLANTFKED